MNVQDYMCKVYGPQPCWELVADIYAREQSGISVDYKTANRSIREMARAFRLAIHKDAHGFVRVEQPVDFAIALLSRNASIGIHHCGIFYQGKILHAQPNTTLYEDLSVIHNTFAVCEFWARS